MRTFIPQALTGERVLRETTAPVLLVRGEHDAGSGDIAREISSL